MAGEEGEHASSRSYSACMNPSLIYTVGSGEVREEVGSPLQVGVWWQGGIGGVWEIGIG